jgi:hypothetical protein
LLRSEALRKDVNAGRIAQKVVNEVNLDEYKKLLTLGNASAAKSRIINVWTNNEKNVAVQGLVLSIMMWGIINANFSSYSLWR